MAHARLDKRRLELFVIAVLHVPQHERHKEVFSFQAFQRVCVHAAGGDQNQTAGFSRILLHIDLRNHPAVACADKDGVFDAERLKEGVHPRHERPVGAQLLRIAEKENAAVAGETVCIIHPHFQRVHAAVQEYKRFPSAFPLRI